MFRALSTRKGRQGYEQLTDETEPVKDPLGPKLSKSRTLPAKFFNSSPKNLTPVAAEQAKKVSKIHPFFSIFVDSRRRRKKATAKPEFSRYVEYLKEGGMYGMMNVKASSQNK
ncbi:uncharacterized protein LOC111380528 [Olea europaea var. sylvestris]|uniref:uncharacterized protein LOC111380528 n=1 Tax=Olea europaea var. sylvestris TaxID=158386 RepID=UPI000C1CD42D|nr:uncharacterized protein LOC111380528 [Olea europaea var. sylvestris]